MGKLYNDYIHSYCLDKERDKEFFELVGDLYFTEEVQGLKIYPQHSNINRLDHITSVTYMSYAAAKRHGLDAKQTVRAATACGCLATTSTISTKFFISYPPHLLRV